GTGRDQGTGAAGRELDQALRGPSRSLEGRREERLRLQRGVLGRRSARRRPQAPPSSVGSGAQAARVSGAEQALPEVLVRTLRRAHHRPVVERADRRGEGWRERIGSDPPTPPASTWTTPSGAIRSRATKRPFRTTSTS